MSMDTEYCNRCGLLHDFSDGECLGCELIEESSQLKKENENLKTQIKEIKQYIPKVGEPSNYVSIDAYENIKEENENLKEELFQSDCKFSMLSEDCDRLKKQLESAIEVIELAFSYEKLTKSINGYSNEYVYNLLSNWIEENPRGEK